MIIDLEVLWDIIKEEGEDKLLEQTCKTCENRSESTCDNCEWICDNKKNVLHRSHYYNSKDEV